MELPESGCGVCTPKVSNYFSLDLLFADRFCSPTKACEWCAYRKKRCHRTEEGSRKRRAGMTETTRPSERVGGKRKMMDEDDGEDVEDGRRTRRKTEQEREEKEWRARIERILVQMDTREKRRAELDEQQVVLGRRLVAGVDWVGVLLEGMLEVLGR